MLSLDSFPDQFHAVVFGAAGGVGTALTRALDSHPRVGRVFAGSRGGEAGAGAKTVPFAFDLTDEASIAAAAEICAAAGPLHLVIVSTGVLHGEGLAPEKTWRAVSPGAFARAFQINATGPALIAKHVLGRLARDDKAAFAALSARVGSISDNRLGGWHAYRASKAALNMLIQTFAIELAIKAPRALCVGLHPGTVDTGLSKPFQAGVPPAALFTPDHSAGRLLSVLDGLTPADSGGCFAHDGARIPA
jgi:NAD(P)-dependent dehydrogenase (short-subunit alcohol dehydrogenase family)